MEEWKEYKIGDITKTNTSQYSLSEGWETIQYLDTGSITKNQISGIEKFFGNIDLPSRARRKVKHGDIVYSCVRPNLCHYGYIDNPPANLLVSTGFAVITVDPNLADARYIYYYLTQNHIVQSLHTIGEQAVSTYPSIKASDIEDLSISLPSLPIQHKIASILKSLDDKIEVNRKINENLEQQAQALFKSWFVDFEPFKNGEFVESELGMIPKGWRVGTLEEIGDIVGGSTPSKSKPEYYTDKGIAWLTPKDLSISNNKFTSKGEIDITEEGYKSCSTKLMPKGSVLFSSRAPIGYITIAKNDICTNQGFKSVVPKLAGTAFIYYFLKISTKDIENKATGSTFKEASGALMKSLQLIIAPEQILQGFENAMTPLFKKQEILEDESRRLAELRDTLLPKLMSGELHINN